MVENPYLPSELQVAAPRRSVLSLAMFAAVFVAGSMLGGFLGYYFGIADGQRNAIWQENAATKDLMGNAR